MSLAFLFHFLCDQHVSDVNTSTLRSLRLICGGISWVVLLWYDAFWCYVVVWLGWRGVRMQASAETCWAWNNEKKASDIRLVSLYSTILWIILKSFLYVLHGFITFDIHLWPTVRFRFCYIDFFVKGLLSNSLHNFYFVTVQESWFIFKKKLFALKCTLKGLVLATDTWTTKGAHNLIQMHAAT